MRRMDTESNKGFLSTCTSESEQEYEVAAILGSRLRDGNVEYLIHWKDYDIRENSWEPLEHLKNCHQLLAEYLRTCTDYSRLATKHRRDSFEAPLLEFKIKSEPEDSAEFYPTSKARAGGVVRYSEGYGTEDALTDSELKHSILPGESDVDADVEDTESRLKKPEILQRSTSKRRRRPKLIKQDTTESEDDVGHRVPPHRWNLRLSPCRGIKDIKEESVSQMRPLMLKGSRRITQKGPDKSCRNKEKSLFSSFFPARSRPNATSSLLVVFFLIPVGAVLLMYILPLGT